MSQQKDSKAGLYFVLYLILAVNIATMALLATLVFLFLHTLKRDFIDPDLKGKFFMRIYTGNQYVSGANSEQEDAKSPVDLESPVSAKLHIDTLERSLQFPGIPPASSEDNPTHDQTALLDLHNCTVDPYQFLQVLSAVDQDKYVLSMMAGSPRDQPKFYWIFKNIDFYEWSSAESAVLWLSGPYECSIAQASADIVDLERVKLQNLVLFLFCSTVPSTQSIAKIFVHAILHQIVCYLPPPNKKQAITIFLRTLLGGVLHRGVHKWPPKEDDSLERMTQKDLETSSGSEHWDGLRAVLKAEQVQKDQALTFVIDGLENVEHGKCEFVKDICALIELLQKKGLQVKALLISLP
ncbi:hypothetical protein K440DRAFT_661138 [Wilcoxina mikolae CBS 423.85]|nr:hypothetical protein K440DRAFT_661138 [Wilcoxina mikolae CBS 423.85]